MMRRITIVEYEQRMKKAIALRDKAAALVRDAFENEGSPGVDVAAGMWDLALAAAESNIAMLEMAEVDRVK